MTELSKQILELRSLGKSYRQIASDLGCAKSTVAYHCSDTNQKEKSIQRVYDKRGEAKKYIQELKQASPCTDCGENYPYWVMDFDHLGDKEFNINSMTRTKCNMDAIKKEIAKCELVCANCHRMRTHGRSVGTGSNSFDVSSDYIV